MHIGPSQQDREVAEGQIEYKKEEWNLLPVYVPGDRYPLFGAITGIIAGIALTIRYWNFFLIAGAIILGGIIGTLSGSAAGFVTARYRNRKPKDNLRGY